MKERPVLFSAPMIKALIDGRKTQTRRIVRRLEVRDGMPHPEWQSLLQCCPYGQPGNRLYVKEKHAFLDVTKSALSQFPLVGGCFGPDVWNLCVEYSDGTENDLISVEGDRPKQTRERGETGWRSPIHMPRWASRILLEVVSVYVERLQDISEADAVAEGIDSRTGNKTTVYHDDFSCQDERFNVAGYQDARTAYEVLWEEINGAGSWDANPWVWVIEFKRVQP